MAVLTYLRKAGYTFDAAKALAKATSVAVRIMLGDRLPAGLNLIFYLHPIRQHSELQTQA
jgi:hypothetical protein